MRYGNMKRYALGKAMKAALALTAGFIAGCAATGPAGSASAALPELEISVRKPADRVEVRYEGTAAVLDVTSPSGIGGATVRLPTGDLPRTVFLCLHLRGLESLRMSDGKATVAVSVLSHSGNPVLVHLDKGGQREVKVAPDGPYQPGVKVVGPDGKPGGIPLQDGYFRVEVPKALLEQRPAVLNLEWIDFYRG